MSLEIMHFHLDALTNAVAKLSIALIDGAT
jgi:hypothetical protein